MPKCGLGGILDFAEKIMFARLASVAIWLRLTGLIGVGCESERC